MFVKAYSASLVGVSAITISVEVNLSRGLGMFLVGLPDSSVKESQDRIRSAFENSNFKMPGKCLVINLAPADVRKEGSSFDLPIAVGILAATEQVSSERIGDYIITGELSLDGTLRPVRGVLPITVAAKEQGFRGVIVPAANASEAAVVEGLEVVAADSLRHVADMLNGNAPIVAVPAEVVEESAPASPYAEDFSDVKGQENVKRALEIAAAGGHNVIMIGAPGSGKTMLARRMPTIMPPMTREEALETTKIHSVAGKLGAHQGLMTSRPFRTPHHTASQVALIGGGSNPRPGEVSLSHNGILFADELPEFGRSALEVMRQPMEDKKITISRAKYSIEYPANFMLIASMNPCPCGYYNHPTRECTCNRYAVHNYLNRISGPLLDRIDLHIEVVPIPIEDLNTKRTGESSAEIRERVMAAREIQSRRFADCPGVHTNAMMNSAMIRTFCPLSDEVAALLNRAIERINLSTRAYDRIIKVARTIADLEGKENIETSHIAEAINYRSLDRDSWGR